MMRMFLRVQRGKSVGQSTAEFAVLLAIIAAAFLAMQIYLKRGVQGRIRNLADQISTTQYEEGRTDSTYVTNQTTVAKQVSNNGASSSNLSEATLRSGNETVNPVENR